VTKRPHSANPKGSTRRGRALAAFVALALLASLVVVASAGAAAASDAAGNPKATGSVIGGHATTIADFPALAYVEGVQATSGYACTGTVVAPRVVLTAGHCVEDIESSSIVEPSKIAVATGVSNLEHIPPANISAVVRVLAYPSFDPALLHGDAGLLILAAPVAAPPIALATKAETALYEPGDELTVAGWGIDKRGTEQTPTQLQAATVPIQETERCRNGLKRFYPFYDASRQLCTLDAPGFKITPCHGDSGGPAIATREDGTAVEVGVVSLGDATCSPRSPAVFTRVDQISTWVQSWIDAVELGGPQPVIRVPKAHIPTLTRERAEELAFIAMDEAFGGTFLHGQEQSIRCERQGKARLKCGVTWYQGANDYFGRVSVFYAIRHNVVLAGSHYAVHWVDDNCYFNSGDPESCQVHSKQR
jgi:secreted trypsin-like serine protease